jgi:beta-ureidopropionase / N-carbamoyl-L-amino-acid hydrolase
MAEPLRINGDRLLADLSALAKIGGTPDGGVNRPALSDADLDARRWLKERAEEDGFEVRIDGTGNVSAILASDAADARTVLFGSHLDSVPNGGRFDGALGVAAALEVLRTVKESGHDLAHHLEAISFTDEEGTWSGLLGSSALAGHLTPDDFEAIETGYKGFMERFAAAGLTVPGALRSRRAPGSIRGWVEVHIEQGTRLEEANTPIGVVTGIVGIARYWLTFVGRADHAGTTPMDRRLDALRGLSEFVRQCRELVMNRFPRGTVNCGIVEVSDGAFNIVPERARLALEFRHSDQGKLDAMREALLSLALHVVEVEGLGLEVEGLGIHEPAPMHREVITAIEAACNTLGLAYVELPSFAGHDTQVMASITQAGMFFVPSQVGASHSPREFTSDNDCINAGNVLLHTVLKLAG